MSNPPLPGADPRSRPSGAALWIPMSGALCAMMLAALDQNIVNTALPRMVADLGGLAHLSWVVTAFMLTSTVTTPLYGKLSDLYGRRALFFVSILVFLGGSLLCGAAQTMGQLIGFRALQGVGAGGLLTLSQAAIGDLVSPRERPRYQGLFTGTFALSSVAGPLLGGIITSALSWRWVFYVNIPVGLAALAMIAIGLPRRPIRRGTPIDYAGGVLLITATTALLLLLAWGGTEFAWLSPASAGLAVATAVLGAAFIVRERRAPEPLVRLSLFRNPIYARGVAASGMMSFAMLGSTVFLPVYFQLVLGMTPVQAGAMMLPQVVGMVLTSVIGGRIVSRLGRNKAFLLAGVGLEVAGLGGLAAMAFVAAPPAAFVVAMGALGMGMGMGMPNLTTAVQNAVAHQELGAATGAMSFTRSLGGALGVAVSGAILAARLAAGGVSPGREHGPAALDTAAGPELVEVYRTALTGCFGMSAAVMALAFVLILGLPEVSLRGEVRRRSAA